MRIYQKAASLSLFAIAFLQLVVLTSDASTPASQTSVLAGFGQTPLRFEPSADQTCQQVRYISRGNGYAMYFLPTEIALGLDVGPATTDLHHPFPPEKAAGHKFGLVHIKLEGASENAAISAEQTLPEKINYFLGNDPSQWRVNQSAYGRVHYQNLYPGIDLVFYGNQTQLEYDFVLAPHTDASAICLKFEGADQIKIEPDGGLAFSVQGRVTRFRRPVLYQTIGGVRRNIAGGYHLLGNRVSFEIGTYNHSQPLVIDPVLSYST
ncbi:MAG TPA: hypothetical protein VNX46_14875, partial [Candidatus Acidoferrum sp.]|nr:hypothetical protein [Candidatus Acidoferrum sp.]